MKLEIALDSREHAILVCDEDRNDIAEFYHNEHATVGQSYETALALAQKLVTFNDAQPAAVTKEEIASLLAEFFCGKQWLRNQAADAILARLASQPSPAATVERNGLVECPTCVRRFRPGEHCDLDTCSLKRLSAANGGASEVLTEIVDFFATMQEGLGDMWAHPDDFSSYGLDYCHRDGTKLWIELVKNGTIHLMWKRGEVMKSVNFGLIPAEPQEVPDAAPAYEKHAKSIYGTRPRPLDSLTHFYAGWNAALALSRPHLARGE